MTYRTGRQLGRTVYRDDKLIGIMDTPEDADLVVKALEAQSATPRAMRVACSLHGYDWNADGAGRLQCTGCIAAQGQHTGKIAPPAPAHGRCARCDSDNLNANGVCGTCDYRS